METSFGFGKTVDLGFDPDRLLTAQLKIQEGTYASPDRRAAFDNSIDKY